MNQRKSGILLHITSLPSSYGIGDLGPSAYRFVDFLGKAGQSYWQILPLNPTGTVYGNAPYSSYSAFAGNPLLISPEFLVEWSILSAADLEPIPHFHDNKVDFKTAIKYKGKILTTAYQNVRTKLADDADFQRFCRDHAHWLDDYSLFVALREHFKEIQWKDWPEKLRDRDPHALKEANEQFADRVYMAKFFQFLFFQQWFSLKAYCTNKNIRLIGDIPIYVSADSADLWSHSDLFKLDAEKNPIYVAGAPPDYFSETGQRWGNPVYKWEEMQSTQFEWWLKRLSHNFEMFHTVRLDHFRGFVAYWEIPAEEETAVKGKWIPAPAMEFFGTVRKQFPDFPIIAEDLGMITPDVAEVIEHFQFPGMKILLFAFGGDLPKNPYAPHNYTRNCVVYTGTHDNNTIHGWLNKEASNEDKQRLFEYLGNEDHSTVHWDLVRLAMTSVADLVIVPMQDLLGLGQEARMNLPSRAKGNWEWRILPEQMSQELAEMLAKLTWISGRS